MQTKNYEDLYRAINSSYSSIGILFVTDLIFCFVFIFAFPVVAALLFRAFFFHLIYFCNRIPEDRINAYYVYGVDSLTLGQVRLIVGC